MKCTSCGFETEAGAQFCGNCGAPMREKKIVAGRENIACPHCSAETPSASRFCQNCGRDVKISVPVTRQAPPTVSKRKRSLPAWVWLVLLLLLIGIGAALIFIQPAAEPAPQTIETRPAQETTPASTDSPAPTMIAEPGEQGLLLYDDFSNDTSGWPAFGGPGEKSQAGYENGQYRFAFFSKCGWDAAWSRDEYGDFIIETAFSTPADVLDVGAGFTMRTREKAWYLLWVYPAQGGYLFQKDVMGQVSELVPLTVSPVIRPLEQGGRLHLKLKVEARGERFDLWIGQPEGVYAYLGSVSDAELKIGHLGPSADCPDGAFVPPVEVLFDWIKVSK